MRNYIKAWSHMAIFKGRSTRCEFWSFFGINLGIMAVGVLLIWVCSALSFDVSAIILSIAYILYVFAAILPTISLGVRRLHDVGVSGWFYLIGFVPIAGPITMFVFSIMDSKGENRYGPNPKEAESESLTEPFSEEIYQEEKKEVD